MFRLFISGSLAILSLLPAYAQIPGFHNPLVGYIYDADSHSVRPLHGIPGASYIGAAVLDQLDSASIAPGGKWAWTVKSGRSVFIRGLSDSNLAESSPDGLINAVDRVVWSHDGSSALLYSSSGNLLQRIRLTDHEALADAPLDLSAWRPVTALAFDPAGRQIAMGIPGSGLYLFQVGQAPGLVSLMTQPVAAAFDETGRYLYAADLDQHQILQFDSGAEGVPFAALDPDSKPTGLAVSAGNRYLLLPDSAKRAVYVYETASHNLANTISLDFAPTRLEPLSAGPTFLLNGDNSNEWLLLLDASQTPALFIVPASASQTQQEELQ